MLFCGCFFFFFPSSRVSKSAQAASVDAGAGTGHRMRPAHGARPLGLLLLRQGRQLFALAQIRVSIRDERGGGVLSILEGFFFLMKSFENAAFFFFFFAPSSVR